MSGKKLWKIQHLDHFFGLHVYYIVKNKKNLKLIGLKYVFFILHGHFSDIAYIT